MSKDRAAALDVSGNLLYDTAAKTIGLKVCFRVRLMQQQPAPLPIREGSVNVPRSRLGL